MINYLNYNTAWWKLIQNLSKKILNLTTSSASKILADNEFQSLTTPCEKLWSQILEK